MRVLIAIFLISMSFGLSAQSEPVTWSVEAEKVDDNEYDIHFTADIERGWSVYSPNMENEEGPVPTTIQFEDKTKSEIELVGDTKEAGRKKEAFDEMFGITLVKFTGKARFTQRVKIEGDTTSISGSVRYMTCDAESCLPPTDVDFDIALD